eukprot:m51a1_g4153 putative ras gtpase (202) ;mRNA; f:250043-250763
MVKEEAGLKMYQVVLFGAGGVGKSCITIRYVQGQFMEQYDPTIEDSYRKQVTVDREACYLDILDTAGQEEFSVIREQYAKAGDGFMCVYSIADESSLRAVQAHLDAISQSKAGLLPASEGLPYACVLAGNKCDLEAERQVKEEAGKEVAQRWGCAFFETSARTKANIDEAFTQLVRMMRAVHHKIERASLESSKGCHCSLL